ncbi:MAG: peptidylprolyl isomerase [Prevotellaceae bacterium]|jgi:peptidyl-prolyl cis-trans isomerase B (cyclophilin B)|nr:peptidylprolyl isomerase [Prevotellaceae bacterium]
MNKFTVITMLATILATSCQKNENVKVLLETSEGNILLQLYDETPQHRDNFVKLVKDGYYDGVLFHRVIESFMIQAGDPESKNPKPEARYGSGGPDYKVPAEIIPDKHHKKGALAAARTQNPEKASSGSQFYIVQGRVYTNDALKEMETAKKAMNKDFAFTPKALEDYTSTGGTPHLDGDYTVFGEVLEGLDTVDKIAETQTRPEDNRPVKDIVIKQAKIVK